MIRGAHLWKFGAHLWVSDPLRPNPGLTPTSGNLKKADYFPPRGLICKVNFKRRVPATSRHIYIYIICSCWIALLLVPVGQEGGVGGKGVRVGFLGVPDQPCPGQGRGLGPREPIISPYVALADLDDYIRRHQREELMCGFELVTLIRVVLCWLGLVLARLAPKVWFWTELV